MKVQALGGPTQQPIRWTFSAALCYCDFNLTANVH